jgi:Kef-type K+ transport system membrane component KefB
VSETPEVPAPAPEPSVIAGGHGGAPRDLKMRVLQAVVLVLFVGLYLLSTRLAPEPPGALGVVTAVGFLLLAATLSSELLENLGLPHLTGYLAAGIIAGPHVMKLIPEGTVKHLTQVNALALALIALAGGAELKLSMLSKVRRSLAWSILTQNTLVLLVVTGAFVALRSFLPFTHDLATSALLGVGLLWGGLAVSRSPSATLGILAQTRAKGMVATATLAQVMSSDVVVLVLMALILTIVRPMIDPSLSFSTDSFGELGHAILGSVAIGTTLGLLLILYLKLVGRALVVLLVALGFVASEILDYLGFEPLLAFLVAGFVVQNLSSQGEKFLAAIEEMGSIVYVVFFATAGAHLDIPLVKQLWPMAVALCAVRIVATAVASRIASRLADDPPAVRTWGWSGLVSQAGVTLGLSALVERAFPSFGPPFRSLALATVALNEVVGPICFKMALDRTGESEK